MVSGFTLSKWTRVTLCLWPLMMEAIQHLIVIIVIPLYLPLPGYSRDTLDTHLRKKKCQMSKAHEL